MEGFGIEAIPVITVIVFLVGQAVKLTPLDDRWIPVICGFCGGLLGVAAMYLMTGFPATDPLTAIAIGIVSGLAATGAHQIYKQLTKEETKQDVPSYLTGPEVEDPVEKTDEYDGKH